MPYFHHQAAKKFSFELKKTQPKTVYSFVATVHALDLVKVVYFRKFSLINVLSLKKTNENYRI